VEGVKKMLRAPDSPKRLDLDGLPDLRPRIQWDTLARDKLGTAAKVFPLEAAPRAEVRSARFRSSPLHSPCCEDSNAEVRCVHTA